MNFILFIVLLALFSINGNATLLKELNNGPIVGPSKTTTTKLKVFADRLFENLFSKEQYSNKTKVTELRDVFDKIKQNPVRFLDLMLTVGKNNKVLADEALKIIDFGQFDQCISLLIDLILQRLDFWTKTTTSSMSTWSSNTNPTTMQSQSSSRTMLTSSAASTMLTSASTSKNTQQTSTPITTPVPQTTITTTLPVTTATTTILYTTSPILPDTVLVDPLYCNNVTASDCNLAPSPGAPLNEIPFICKSFCACQGVLTCLNNGVSVLNAAGNCRCLCAAGFSGSSCQTSDREFCQLSLKPACTDSNIKAACPSLCSS